MKYKIYISWRCDQEEYYCTDSEEYEVEDLLELPEKVKYIERRGTILNIEISKV